MTSISTKWMSSSLTLPPNYLSPGAHSPWPPPCLDHSCPRRWPSSPRPQSLPASTAAPLSALAYIPNLCRHMPSHTRMIALSQMQHFLHQLRPGMAPLGPCCGTRLLSPFSELLCHCPDNDCAYRVCFVNILFGGLPDAKKCMSPGSSQQQQRTSSGSNSIASGGSRHLSSKDFGKGGGKSALPLRDLRCPTIIVHAAG